MAITQDRMLALIRSAEEFYNAYRSIARRIEGLAELVITDQLTPEAAWNDIVTFNVATHIRPDATYSLGAEKTRFSHSYQRDNKRRREKMAQKRRDQGVTPRLRTVGAVTLPPLPTTAPPVPMILTTDELETIELLSRPDALVPHPAPPPVPRHRHLMEGFKIDENVELVIEPAARTIEPGTFDPSTLATDAPEPTQHKALEYPDDGPTDAEPDDHI